MGRLNSFGIEKIRVYPTQTKLDLSLLANERGYDVNHMKTELMVYERGVIPVWEDPVTMAINAAKPMLTEADKQSIGLLIVATETGLDLEKSLSSWVHRFLELPSYCRHFEVKAACYSGTAALKMALSWINSDFAKPNQKALVITTDHSLHVLNKPWEYVGGAGATAILVSQQPDLLVIEPEKYGVYSEEVSDVIRPLPWVEASNSETSLFSYMEGLINSYENYVENIGAINFEDYFNYNIYHVPFGGISYRSHKQLMRLEGDYTKDEILKSFNTKVLPSIRYPQKIGGTYSSSIFIALLSLVRHAENIKSGDRVGIFSYGSGSCAEFYSGIIGDKAKEITQKADLDNLLKTRFSLSVKEYETFENIRFETSNNSDFKPDINLIPGLFESHYQNQDLLIYTGSKNYYRNYEFS